ncbi:hypothetical protein HPB48_011990 [Haemaphysalis longicornis]|uniref:Reverse transcriptase domain-containing protein n=1 Tax=Haemaphysalis longicornis TaxID=44386 RepID=A0A9J6H757_HAELO|nr:hypothetical protein HPB48_011990 [Haemaphysalis longicornis]
MFYPLMEYRPSRAKTQKYARIAPVLKPGKIPTVIESHHPIALLICVGKLVEKMVLYRLEWDLAVRNVYPAQTSGFRKGRSSMDNAIALATSIKRAKYRRNIIIVVFLDIKSANDCVSLIYRTLLRPPQVSYLVTAIAIVPLRSA